MRHVISVRFRSRRACRCLSFVLGDLGETSGYIMPKLFVCINCRSVLPRANGLELSRGPDYVDTVTLHSPLRCLSCINPFPTLFVLETISDDTLFNQVALARPSVKSGQTNASSGRE